MWNKYNQYVIFILKKKIKMVGGGKKIMANFYIPKYHV